MSTINSSYIEVTNQSSGFYLGLGDIRTEVLIVIILSLLFFFNILFITYRILQRGGQPVNRIPRSRERSQSRSEAAGRRRQKPFKLTLGDAVGSMNAMTSHPSNNTPAPYFVEQEQVVEDQYRQIDTKTI